MIKKIVIVRPYGDCGGTLVLDVLCKLLRERGVDARIFYIPYNYDNCPRVFRHFVRFWLDWVIVTIKSILPIVFRCHTIKSIDKRLNYYRRFYSESMVGLKRQYMPFVTKRTLVVYPEVMYGNILNASNVVRWFLYFNRYSGNMRWYKDTDFFICYRKIFNDWDLNPHGNSVCLKFFDNKKYYQYNFGKRDGKCYIIRKGVGRKDLPLEFDGPVIDNLTEDEKVRVLNECEFCYSYDTQTFYCQIAAVCGCLPVVVPEPGKDASDYISEGEEASINGVAYGDSTEELKRAKETRDSLLQSLEYTEINNQNIDKFVSYVEKRFGDILKMNHI